MSFRQVYYTSCKTGLRGSPGFQVHAATPGIADNVMQQVERLCVYVPPLSAPGRPSAGELEQFPLALIYEKLPDGTKLLGQSRYIGTDYSGRFGNYFAHSIITAAPEKDFARLLPIQLWRSAFWRTAEVTGPALPETTLPPSPSALDLPAVSRILRENGRLEHVANFITAAEQALRTKRKVVIVDTSDAVANWIAVASLVLPRNLALQLTFNTYVKNPYQTDVLMVGTTTDSDFGFAPHEIQHMVFLFDFAGSRFTPIEQTSLFSRSVADCFRQGSLDRLTEFCTFISGVAPDLTIDALDVALATYHALSGMPLPGVTSAQVASFCAPRLARFPEAQLGALITLALTGEAMAVMESALLLLHAARAPEVSRSVQVAAVGAFVAWSIRTAARTASSEALTQLIADLALATERRVAAQPYHNDWQTLITGTKEPVRLLLQLLLGEQLGYLEEVNTAIAALGETVIGPALHEAQVQRLSLRLVGGGRSTPLVNGLAAYLLRKVAEPQTFVQLGLLLTNDEVMGLLQSWAAANQAILLQFRLIGARAYADANKRAGAFARCIMEVKDPASPLTPTLAERAFESCWLDGRPTAEDALRILAVLQRELVAQTYLPARLAECLKLTGSKSLEPPSIELAAQLNKAPLRESLGKNATVVDLFQAAAHLEAAAWPTHLPAVLVAMQKAGPEAAAALCRRTAERVVGIVDLELQQKLLVEACAGCTWFAGAYVQAMEQRFRVEPTLDPPTISDLLRQWLFLETASPYPQLGTLLITQALPVAMRDWKRSEFTLAKKALGNDKVARKRLRAVLDGESKQRGILTWFAIVFLSLSLVFTIVWIVQGKQIMAKLKIGASTEKATGAAASPAAQPGTQ